MKAIKSNKSVLGTCLGACALLGVMVAGHAQGATIRYQASGDYTNVYAVTGTSGWQSGGTGPGGLPGTADTIRFNWGGNTVTLTNFASTVTTFQMGVDESGTLVVNNGGQLTATGQSTVGNNSSANSGVVGRLTVNAGGQVTVNNVLFVGNSAARNVTGILTVNGGTVNVTSHLWAGSGASTTGYIYLTNGGTLNIGGNIGLGTINASTPSGSAASVYVQDGGVLNLHQISATNSIQPNSVLDITGSGVVTVTNDYTTVMSYYTNVGRITAYGGLGTVGIDYNHTNANKTTLFAIAPVVGPPTSVVWNPAGNPSGTGHWNEATNWTGFVLPASVTKVVFNVSGAIPCTVTNAAVAKYVSMGDQGPGGTLIITNGGSLTCSADSWSGIGYNSNALMIVESGGSVSFGSHLWIGLNSGADGTLIMHGGTVSVGGAFGLGYNGSGNAGTGTALIHGGQLNLASAPAFATTYSGSGLLDVASNGVVVIAGNQTAVATIVNYYIGTGQITNSDGTGLVVDYNHINVGKTTLYAADNSSISLAQTTWNPVNDNPTATEGFWNVSSNWDGGLVPASGSMVHFNIDGELPCWVTNAAVAGRIDMGDGGPGGTLIVTNGGNLTVSGTDWSAIGYNSNALMIVENGGAASFGYHLWIGFSPGANGTLTLNGGTVSVTGMFGLGYSGGTGIAHINGGTLNLAQWNGTQSISGTSVLDVAGTGEVVIAGDQTLSVSNYVSSGKITANGGPSVYYGYDSVANKTTVSAVSPAPPRQMITAVTVSGGNATLTYQTTAGHTYHIEGTPSLSPPSWTPVTGSTNAATGAPVTFTFPVSGNQRFYRTVSP